MFDNNNSFVSEGSWVVYKEFHDWRRDRSVTEELIEAFARLDGRAANAVASKLIRAENARKQKRKQDLHYARRKREAHGNERPDRAPGADVRGPA